MSENVIIEFTDNGVTYIAKIFFSKHGYTSHHDPFVADYHFYRDGKKVGEAGVRLSVRAQERVLYTFSVLEADLASVASHKLEKVDVENWERCNWNTNDRWENYHSDEDEAKE
jgi:hypothetical protein